MTSAVKQVVKWAVILSFLERYTGLAYIDCNALADTCEDNLAEVEEIVGIKDAGNLDDNQVEDSMRSKVG